MRRAAGIITVLLLTGGYFAAVPRSDDPRRGRAVALSRQAAHAHAYMQADSAFELLVRALQTDPTYTAAVYDLTRNVRFLLLWRSALPRLETILRRDPDSAAAECRWRLLQRTHKPSVTYRPGNGSSAEHECARFHRVMYAPAGASAHDRLPELYALWQLHPHSPALAGGLQGVLLELGDPARVRGIARELKNGHGVLPGMYGLKLELITRHKLGRDTMQTAGEIERYLRARPAALRYQYLVTRGQPRISLLHMADSGDSIAALQEYHGAAYDLASSGELRRALPMLDSLLRTAARWRAEELQAPVLTLRGRTLVKMGVHAEAERALLAAREIALRIDDPLSVAEATHNLLHLYETMNRPADAEHVGLEFARAAAGHPGYMVGSAHDLTGFYIRGGQHGAAQHWLNRLATLTDSIGDYSSFAGEYFEVTGQLERALNYYARNAREPHPDLRRFVRLSALSEAMGDTAAALRYARAHDDSVSRAYPEFSPVLPGLLLRLGQHGAAEAAAQASLARAERNGQLAAAARAQLDLARIAFMRHERKRALERAQSAAVMAKGSGAPQVELLAAALQLAVDPTSRAGAWRGLVERAARLGSPETELQIAELQAEARATAEPAAALRAYERAAQIAHDLAQSLDADVDRVRFRAAHLRISQRALSLATGSLSGSAAACAFVRWSQLRKAREMDRSARPVRDCADIARFAPGERAAVLDYVVLDSAVAALLITRDRMIVRRLPTDPADLRSKVEALRSRLVVSVGGYLDTPRARLDSANATALFDALLAPFAVELRDKQQLTVVPDDVLHRLPFDALIERAADGRGRYAGDRFRLTLLPALQYLGQSARQKAGPITAVAFDSSGSLGTQDELRAIAAAFPNNVRQLVGGAATREAVTQAAPGSAVLHLAAHAQPGLLDPRYGYVRLASRGSSDGKWYAHEIAQQDLQGALVVLSVCESAQGRLYSGEGMLSLGRAFRQAGASATISTLWPVGAASAEFMHLLYQSLAAGVAPDSALHAAKRTFMTSRWSHPIYWAGYVFSQ